MPQFFVQSKDIEDGRCVLTGNDARHLQRVRRVKSGDTISLRTETGSLFTASVVQIANGSLHCVVIEDQGAVPIPLIITLYAAIIKGSHFDLMIQKAIEVGVSTIVPIVSERSVPDLAGKEAKKLSRWNRIAHEAAKQCMRSSVPAVAPIETFQGAITKGHDGVSLIAHPGAPCEIADFLRSEEKSDEVSLLVGPEGGFSDEEVAAACDAGWRAVNFGSTHLRAETAGIVLPAIILYEWGY